ncbi:MAG: hypothetical protein Fur0010_01300 [Bdellovibrio sp.]
MNNPIESLHQNVDAFFDKIQKKYSDQIHCKKGCDLCCYTDISVSKVEVLRIETWFNQLDQAQREKLLVLWNQKQPHGKTYGGGEAQPCAFLYHGECSIYSARPTICRSHGIALLRNTDESIKEIDACELNFSDQLPPIEDCLELDRLNTLIAVANSAMKFDEQRLPLKKLKERFLASRKTI